MSRKKKRKGSGGLMLYKRPLFVKKKKEKELRFIERIEQRQDVQRSYI